MLYVGAVQRYFKHRKRNLRESDPAQKECVAFQAKAHRQKSRRFLVISEHYHVPTESSRSITFRYIAYHY